MPDLLCQDQPEQRPHDDEREFDVKDILSTVWTPTKKLLKNVNEGVLPNVDAVTHLPGLEEYGAPLAGLSGLLTAVTHDPANDGVLGVMERLGVGAIDTLHSLVTGPVGLIDSTTGNNSKGFFQGGFSSLLSLMSGDRHTMEKQSDKLQQGDYGGTLALGSSLADLGTQKLTQLITGSKEPIDTFPVEKNLGTYVDKLDEGSNWNPMNWIPKTGSWLGTKIGDKLGDPGKTDPKQLDEDSRKLIKTTDEIDRDSDGLRKLGYDPQELKVDANMNDSRFGDWRREMILKQAKIMQSPEPKTPTVKENDDSFLPWSD